MNEEKLASLLAQQIDALVQGEPSREPPPAAVAELLPFARDLLEAAPVPRPAFGPALKESLLTRPAMGQGTAASASSVAVGKTLLIVVAGLLALAAALALILGAISFGLNRRSRLESPSVPSPLVSTPVVPAGSALPPPPPTATSELPALNRATDVLPAATAAPTPTALLDILPQVTGTAGRDETLPAPPALEPGPANPDQDPGDGDHNRGHGNDPGGHDEDNPGHGNKQRSADADHD
jgi:hypothetical protein